MKRTFQVVLIWLTVLIVISCNIYVYLQPSNELTTSQILDLHPNLLMPASYTSGIWIFIFLLHILHASYSTYIYFRKTETWCPLSVLTEKMNRWFLLAGLLNVGWVLTWHNQQYGWSLFFSSALYLTLMAAFARLTKSERTLQLTYFQHVSLETPFIIYIAWLTFVFLSNLTVYLYSIGQVELVSNSLGYTVSMIILATILALIQAFYFKRPAFAAVIVWALIGIYVQQHNGSFSQVGYIALAAILLCLVASVISFWRKRSLLYVR
ncbi:hypothetical protein [Polluticaenibacter yanchengensis]|uniref:Tryptophan-rich sensory protein n=1 Tax=Polluticaenibacter yanchengensis TaxID=3014562 RepID=A0ABT4UMF1_9BACT|nr:hypothetical protein [Chitinophagaceae bacterium LY-5]